MSESFGARSHAAAPERAIRSQLMAELRGSPLPDDELANNLGLYLTRQSLSRLLFMHELYRMILEVHGVVMEFGVRWGQNLSLFQSFRGMYEPFNYSRMVVGFDTFEGFPAVDAQDGGAGIKAGDYAVSKDWQGRLEALLEAHEQLSPLAQKKKHVLVKGDASQTIHRYLEENPQTVVALAYFDFDLYAPTKACLEAILPRLTKGSVVAFDELNCPDYPGETLAVMETIGLSRWAIRRSPLNPYCSYAVVD
jgi:hypothetical protein